MFCDFDILPWNLCFEMILKLILLLLNQILQGHRSTMWLCNSLGDIREVLGSSLVEPRFFFLPYDIWWLIVGPSSKLTVSSVTARFRVDSDTNQIKQGATCHRSTVWLGISIGIVLARYASGSGFESRSGHVLFPPLWHQSPLQFRDTPVFFVTLLVKGKLWQKAPTYKLSQRRLSQS